MEHYTKRKYLNGAKKFVGKREAREGRREVEVNWERKPHAQGTYVKL